MSTHYKPTKPIPLYDMIKGFILDHDRKREVESNMLQAMGYPQDQPNYINDDDADVMAEWGKTITVNKLEVYEDMLVIRNERMTDWAQEEDKLQSNYMHFDCDCDGNVFGFTRFGANYISHIKQVIEAYCDVKLISEHEDDYYEDTKWERKVNDSIEEDV